jgi:hypothetical protein
MARDPAPAVEREWPVYLKPWFLVGAGFGVSALGAVLAVSWQSAPPALRVLLLLAGLFIALAGLIVRLRQRAWVLPERIETAAMLLVTGLGCLMGYYGMATWTVEEGRLVATEEWASGRMLFGALFIVSLLGALLVLLPPIGRRVVLSLVVLYHFAGVGVAITSVDPPGSTGPWICKQLWAHAYRPYLSFMYLTNAYHFYSPDPGPPSLFWFAICYDDGSYTWVKLPERANSPIYMHYQRLLALPEHSFAPQPRLPFNVHEMRLLGKHVPEDMRQRGPWEDILRRRQLGSTRPYVLMEKEDDQVVEKYLPIPIVIGMAENLQYREPHETSKRLVAAVARRIYWNAPPAPREGVNLRSVKVYRVTHQILTPQELANGVNPLARTKHWPYFLGEFDSEGKMVDPLDPFLYWYLPISYVPNGYPRRVLKAALGAPIIHVSDEADNSFLIDSMEMHAAGLARKPKKAAPDNANKAEKEEKKQ